MKNKINLIFTVIIGLMMVTLSGCATSGGYKKQMDSWIGKSSKDFFVLYGVPHEAMSLGKKGKLYCFNSRRIAVAYQAQSYDNGSGYYANVIHPYNVYRSCKTCLQVKGGVIKTISWRGNDCKR